VSTVLFVGAGRHQRGAIAQARARGLRVVAVDRNPQAPGLLAADVPEVVDFTDVESVTEAARRHRVDGVLTVAADRAVPVVAGRVGPVRDDHRDPRVETAIADGVDDGFEVRPAARDEDAE